MTNHILYNINIKNITPYINIISAKKVGTNDQKKPTQSVESNTNAINDKEQQIEQYINTLRMYRERILQLDEKLKQYLQMANISILSKTFDISKIQPIIQLYFKLINVIIDVLHDIEVFEKDAKSGRNLTLQDIQNNLYSIQNKMSNINPDPSAMASNQGDRNPLLIQLFHSISKVFDELKNLPNFIMKLTNNVDNKILSLVIGKRELHIAPNAKRNEDMILPTLNKVLLEEMIKQNLNIDIKDLLIFVDGLSLLPHNNRSSKSHSMNILLKHFTNKQEIKEDSIDFVTVTFFKGNFGSSENINTLLSKNKNDLKTLGIERIDLQIPCMLKQNYNKYGLIYNATSILLQRTFNLLIFPVVFDESIMNMSQKTWTHHFVSNGVNGACYIDFRKIVKKPLSKPINEILSLYNNLPEYINKVKLSVKETDINKIKASLSMGTINDLETMFDYYLKINNKDYLEHFIDKSTNNIKDDVFKFTSHESVNETTLNEFKNSILSTYMIEVLVNTLILVYQNDLITQLEHA